ncbi:G-type lectin S-receptor-like serine/threonine-protein kinase At2g19130 [Zingiber officinale]|uniref:Receptor-like serine/threonine-protein kinase n=1 Tax=Zingiber officinale TaxID=94328 RepID=A0A8J5BVE6_ZINOF|nr:G-type lectin S-receptor-like serine/threonine-protein kinase At2g19130 [Zingiber officinale]KAG6468243.1 hypothetical protein ZIOFF_072816 [Zingiber officinale]
MAQYFKQLAMAPCSTAARCFFFSPSPSLLLLCSFAALHYLPLSSAIDSISANNSLKGNQSTISVGGNFRLGFFTPTGSSSLNFYIGIWYDKISVFTPVWVANRATPVKDPTASELRISGDGNLVLLLDNSSIIWSTNVTIPSDSATVAVILDTGNLQLRDESNSSLVFWQSFDHPTDTWLPGAKLRFDKLTNRTQPLTAWKSKVDPAPGIFTLEVDPAGTYQCYMLWNSSRIYWSSGLWNGNTFGSIPEIAPSRNFGYGYQFVDNEEEFYFAYTIDNPNMISRNVLDHDSGLSQQWTWTESSKSWVLYWTQPPFRCSVFALCGSFSSCNDFTSSACNCIKGFRIKSRNDWDLGDKTAGCERITPLQCEQNNSIDSQRDGFFMMTNVRLPDKADTLDMAGTSEECELACLNNCSCNAYSYNTTGCYVWHGDLLNLQEQYNQPDAGTLYLRLSALELQSSGSNKNRVVTWVIVGVVSTIVLLCLAIVTVWIMISKRRSRKMIQNLNRAQSSLVSFTYSELQHATRNFSEKIGGGGFGSVFKGSLPGSVAIAVKKLEGLRQGEKQFRTEVSTIGRIQHINLVRMLGFCSQRSEKLLVYEFMPNGSLNSHLFDRTAPSTVLNWRTRYQIAIGVAKGLDYLHEQCRDCIIHCDIKPENILLDASFNPKVADFGLAKLMGRDFSRVVTTLRGTPGYLAPEWITGVAITTKADVYSYGMMLLEIISGRRNVEQTEQSSDLYYHPTSMASKLIAGEVATVLDGGLGHEEVDMEELERACKIAFWCIQNEESCRPTMGQVLQVLEGVVDVDMPPVPRSLQLIDNSESETINFFH